MRRFNTTRAVMVLALVGVSFVPVPLAAAVPCSAPKPPGCTAWTVDFAGAYGSDDYGDDVAVSPDGSRVFITGTTKTGTVESQWITRAYNAETSALLWSATLASPIAAGFAGGARGKGIAVSPDGSTVFVTGTEWGGETWTVPRGNREDIRTVAYNAATGALVWSQNYSGPWADSVAGIAVSGDGTRVVITGQTLTGAASSSGPEDGDVLVVSYDTTTGAQQWLHTSDGTAGFSDEGWAIAAGGSGSRVHVAALRWNTGATGDIVTMAFDGSATPVWTRVFDGPAGHYQRPSDIAVSKDGQRIAVTDITVIPAVDYDFVTLLYDAAGVQQWPAVEYGLLPDSSHDVPLSVALSPKGDRVFVTGLSGPSRGTGGSIMYTEPVTVAYAADAGTHLWTARQSYSFQGSSEGYEVAVSDDGLFVYVVALRGDSSIKDDIQTLAYLASTGTPLWSSSLDSPAGSADGTPDLAVNPETGWVHVTGEKTGSGIRGDLVLTTLDPVYQKSSASMTIPWGAFGLRAGGPPAANPTLGYVAQGGTAVSPDLGARKEPEDTITFSVDAGRLGQFEHLEVPHVQLYLELDLELLTTPAAGAHAAAEQVGELEVRKDGSWLKAADLTVTPVDAGNPAAGYRFATVSVDIAAPLLKTGVNEFRIRVLDGLTDGTFAVLGVVLQGALLQLAAPPTIILHGWDPGEYTAWNWHQDNLTSPSTCSFSVRPPVPGALDWQCATRDRLIAASREAFGQNVWHWDAEAGRVAVRPFAYNPKRHALQVAQELRTSLATLLPTMGWNGKPALFGYSYGGIVARAFANDAAGLAADTVVTQASPLVGTLLADYYTCNGLWSLLNDPDDYFYAPVPGPAAVPLLISKSGNDCTWRDYHDLSGGAALSGIVYGAYKFKDDLAPAFDYMADFLLKAGGPTPGSVNPFLLTLREGYASLPQEGQDRHLAIAGVCSKTITGATTECPNGLWLPNGMTQLFVNDKLDPTGGAPSERYNDMIVPRRSALMRSSGGPVESPTGVVCYGDAYVHTNIFNVPEPAMWALIAISDVWDNDHLNTQAEGADNQCRIE